MGSVLGSGINPHVSSAEEGQTVSPSEGTGTILTLGAVLRLVEQSHPLLRGSQTEKLVASGKVLRALGAFEPQLVNDWELERLVKDGSTKSVGFNDTFVELQHPWGIKGFAGFRAGIGDVEVADLGINTSNQPLLGIVFPLLRGLATNPAHAELKKSELAQRQADLEIQRTKQELYLGASIQFWNWVASWKLVDLRQRALDVADARFAQLKKQESLGARAQFDVTEGHQEVQRRRDMLINAKRQVEQEQYKLALFLWENDNPVVPSEAIAPTFPPLEGEAVNGQVEKHREQALDIRPEIQLVVVDAAFNNIDLEVAENNYLPELTADAQPTRKPGEFVLGLGYRFGVQFSFPFLQRSAKGDFLQLQGKTQRLKFLLQYRRHQVLLDIENARSAINRARERIHISRQALDLAKELEKGERTRFKLGANSLIFVNLRERNVVEAGVEWIHALAEYQKSLALYQWAVGDWIKTESLAFMPNSLKVSFFS